MDKAKRYAIYTGMKKQDLLIKALELAAVADALREYIDAIPEEVEFSEMPGVDRDWVDSVLDS